MKIINDTLTLCSNCDGIIETIHAGDEWWNVCQDCRNVEGPTYEVTEDEYEKIVNSK